MPASFLSKPFRTSDLVAAIDLAIQRKSASDVNEELPIENFGLIFQSGNDLFCKTGAAFRKVNIDSVKWIEADGSYSHIVMDSSRITITEPLGKVEEKLTSGQFIRIHRSFMVNLGRVTAFQNRSVNIEETELPLSKGFEESFMRALLNKKS